MAVALINSFSRFINPSWLTGPIFDKELRVSSRRRRNYVLRSAYLLVLVFLVAAAWATALLRSSGTSVTWQVSRMAEIGRSLVLMITWLQFLTAQILAAVMLSNSISDEIRRGTMDVLMTTPINCVQIVLGKLFSKLLQLILVLAVSLPLLAVIRVFGGIQWDYVVSALSITLTATVFVGSLSMFLSTRFRRSYLVILIMTTFLVVAYLFMIPLSFFRNSNNVLMSVILHINPFAAMTQVTSSAFPGSRLGTTFFSLPLHCLVMGGASMVILFASAFRMRRHALESFLGTNAGRKLPIWKRNFISSAFKSNRSFHATRPIRPVTGSPIFWKELPKPFSKSLKSNAIVLGIFLLLLFIFCYLAYLFKAFSSPMPVAMIFYSMFTSGIWMIATIRTAAMAATSITKEKEARTLPLLLGTLLEPKQIIHGKALAALWRNAPAWLILALGTPVFYILMIALQKTQGSGSLDFYYYSYIIFGPLGIVANVIFLIGLGMYFSTRLKSSTAAVMATIGSLLGFYVIRQFMFTFLFAVLGVMMMGNVQFALVLNPIFRIVFNAVIGMVLLWRAKCRLRLDIF
ncbi:MAG: ABC transporter permease [Planctomycetota bacterium]|jgi:ABC-type transport system involved in multi-copper enzyme maturation permease subunit